MNCRIEFKNFGQTVWSVTSDSQRVLNDSWCWQVPGRSTNALGLFLGLESSPNHEIRFEFYGVFSKFVESFTVQFFRLIPLGLGSGLCSEAIRSKTWIKSLGIYCFEYLISLRIFHIFSMCIFVQSCQSAPNLSPFVFTRNIEYQTCIKRLVKAILIFFMYLIDLIELI